MSFQLVWNLSCSPLWQRGVRGDFIIEQSLLAPLFQSGVEILRKDCGQAAMTGKKHDVILFVHWTMRQI
jgi:hypothetical protein